MVLKNTFSCTIIFLVFVCISSIENPEDFVNLLAGTFTDGNSFSTGNTLPLVGLPFAFNHWSPQSYDEHANTGSWWFRGYEHTLTWLRCTHQPSPWIGDWGYFAFGPQLGRPQRNPIHYWEPRGAIIKPYTFDATVAPYGIRLQLAPTMHGAYFRTTFPSHEHTEKNICFVSASWTSDGNANGLYYIEGRATQVHRDRMLVNNFGLSIRLESSEAIGIEKHQDMICFKYSREANIVHVRMATSLISIDQAKVNLNREVPLTKTFENIRDEARKVWNTLLRRADVIDSGPLSGYTTKHLTVFYTGLVRALTFPRHLDEINSDGKVIHYSPYDPQGGIHDGPLVTDNGFWDTFRTVYPMLTLIYPDLLGPIIQGWLNAYKEGGWLPSWASPGYRNCMVGTYADVVISDAIVRKVLGFDMNLAHDALVKDAFEAPPAYAGNAVGKEGLNEYNSNGYVAINHGQRGGDQISRTLDFGFADYATSEAFKILAELPQNRDKKTQLLSQIDQLKKRSIKASSILFDRTSGLMVSKSSDGQLNSHVNEFEWGNGYTEGNAWHHSFPPYALETMIGLYGSKQAYLNKIKQILTRPGTFAVGTYNQEIHEMVEARALAMGQYSHNNQPCHHILYLFALLGDPVLTQKSVRKVMNKGYGVDFYAGDEDNGEQGAWFVLSALGLFVTTPGSTQYVLGSPIFKHVRIQRIIDENTANILDIYAPGTNETVEEVSYTILNNKKVNGPTITHDDLFQITIPTSSLKDLSSSSSSSNLPLDSELSIDSLSSPPLLSTQINRLHFVMKGSQETDLFSMNNKKKTNLRFEPIIPSTKAPIYTPLIMSTQSSYRNQTTDTIESLQLELKYNKGVLDEMRHQISYLKEKNIESSSTTFCPHITNLQLMGILILIIVLVLYYMIYGSTHIHRLKQVLKAPHKADSHTV